MGIFFYVPVVCSSSNFRYSTVLVALWYHLLIEAYAPFHSSHNKRYYFYFNFIFHVISFNDCTHFSLFHPISFGHLIFGLTTAKTPCAHQMRNDLHFAVEKQKTGRKKEEEKNEIENRPFPLVSCKNGTDIYLNKHLCISWSITNVHVMRFAQPNSQSQNPSNDSSNWSFSMRSLHQGKKM